MMPPDLCQEKFIYDLVIPSASAIVLIILVKIGKFYG